MKKKRLYFIILMLCLVAFGAFITYDVLQTSAPKAPRPVEVKGLVLKYALINTADEMDGLSRAGWNNSDKMRYSKMGEDTYLHYQWLKATYESFDENLKADLYTIFDTVNAWYLMNLTTPLEDDAEFDEILKRLQSSRHISRETKGAMEQFFTHFYENVFQAYLAENEATFQAYADTLNEQLAEQEPDVIGFMESQSGIKFEKNYKPEFYFTLAPIGAMGFKDQERKISTIQRTVRSYEYLLGTPFHEFTHELFQTFTSQRAFAQVAEELKTIKIFEEAWQDKYHRSYDWIGWCEENLVEGFAKYLEYKYYGVEKDSGIYHYDRDFYLYLREIDFNPENISLEEASITFYQSVLANRP